MPTLGTPAAAGGGLMTIDFDPELIVLVAEVFAMGNAIGDLREPLERAVVEVAIPAVGRNFDQEGPGWPAHAEATVNGPEYSGHPLLQLTGALREAATDIGIWHIGDEEATVDVADTTEYGPIHDIGGSFIPQRQFFFLTEGDLVAIEDIFLEHVEQALDVGGF